ncbi:MAG: hypothetical protein ACXVUE_11490 [Solirubrobacteraceae bacterium]
MELVDQPTVQHEQHEQYEQCEQCGAAVDRAQRYCVSCGTRRRHVRDPATRYMSSATSRSRAASSTVLRKSGATRRERRSYSLGLALALAVIPLAVGLGVLVGRASNSGDDKLIAALRAQKPEVITTGGGAAATAATTATSSSSKSVATLTSSFPLQSGYAVQLQTLPSSSSSSAVTKAEQTATTKGAPHTGLILQRDFRVTPAPPSGAYVIYSGAYKTHADAAAALAKLHHKFPSAKVIRVQPVGSSATSGKVLAKTNYGSAHEVAGFKPGQAQLNAGAKAVQKIQQGAGKGYVDSQRGLPDQISVP